MRVRGSQMKIIEKIGVFLKLMQYEISITYFWSEFYFRSTLGDYLSLK